MKARRLRMFAVIVQTAAFLAAADLGAVTVRALVVRGIAQVQARDAGDFDALRQGDVVPLGATIRTGVAARVQLTPLPGVVSMIGPESTVVVSKAEQSLRVDGSIETQHGMLELRRGSVTTSIDGFRAGVTDFGIQTPRGVAAARGTVYTVSYDSEVQTVIVYNGAVTVQTSTATFVLQNGFVSITGMIGGREYNLTSSLAELSQRLTQDGVSETEAAAVVAQVQTSMTAAVEVLLELARSRPDAVPAAVLQDVKAAMAAAAIPIPPDLQNRLDEAIDAGTKAEAERQKSGGEPIPGLTIEEIRVEIVPTSPDGV